MNQPPCPRCQGTDIAIAWTTQDQAQLACRGCGWSWLVELEQASDMFVDRAGTR